MKTVYHGSPNNFTAFEIKEELVKRGSQSLAEGLGIYMTEDKDMAAGYGSYIYAIEITEDSITDFTNRKVIVSLLNSIFKEVDIDASLFLDLDTIVDSVLSGNISVTKFYKEISDWLDSNPNFYEKYQERITYEEDCLLEQIKSSFFNNVEDTLKYYDMSFKVPVYICFRNPENIKIRSVEQLEKDTY